MVTVDNLTTSYIGLSTDDKPTENIRNGSTFIEMDTQTMYAFDEDGQQWIKQSGGGGGGGETTVTIYDGDVEVSNDDYPVYFGRLTPDVEPTVGKSITIEVGDGVYNTTENGSDEFASWWVAFNESSEETVILEKADGGWVFYVRPELLPSQDSPQTIHVKITQAESGGGGGDTTVTIFDGDVEVSYDDNPVYLGQFTPSVEPDSNPLTIEFNGETYETNPKNEFGWMLYDNGLVIGVGVADEGYQLGINPNLMPSQESPQAVSVKITQTQSGGGNSDFSIVTLYLNNQTSETLSAGIPVLIDNGAACKIDVMPSEFTETYNIPLYKGQIEIYIDCGDYSVDTYGSIARYQDTPNWFLITGAGGIDVLSVGAF